MIEVGRNLENEGALIIHSTDSGRFLAVSREEWIEMVNSITRGEMNGFLATPGATWWYPGDDRWPTPSPAPVQRVPVGHGEVNGNGELNLERGR